HRQGVIHRDLKPSNIYLVEGDLAHAKLIDLGIAKSAMQNLTESGQILGTPGYMAPEQARGDKDADARIDLFALGCVLYEMLAGRPPFEGTAVMEVLARLLLETPPAIETFVPGVPPRLAQLIAHLLAKDPDHRVADASLAFTELDAILRAIVDGDRRSLERVPPPPIALSRAPTMRARRAVASPVVRTNRWWWVWKIALPTVAGVVGVIVLLVLMVRSTRTKCNDTRRKGCANLCAQGDAKACELAAEALRDGLFRIAQDRPAAVAAFVRGCELREPGVCARGVRALDQMLAANELPKATLVPAIESLLATGCKLDDNQACFQLALRHTPGVGAFAPDPVRAYDLAIKACAGSLDTACNHLTSMLDAGLGDEAQRQRAQATRDDACGRGVMLCAKGSLAVSSSWATEAMLDGDKLSRTALPHKFYISAGAHKLTYLRGDRRCDQEVKVAPSVETQVPLGACTATAENTETAPRFATGPAAARKPSAPRPHAAAPVLEIEVLVNPFEAAVRGDSRGAVVVAKVKRAYLAGIGWCYSQHLKNHPGARGTISMILSVTDTGRTSEGSVYGFAPAVDACIKKLTPSWRFPITRSPSGLAVAATFSLRLKLSPS
ncbi:MAG: protein kinase, partial [Kofleriaceae bacterium]